MLQPGAEPAAQGAADEHPGHQVPEPFVAAVAPAYLGGEHQPADREAERDEGVMRTRRHLPDMHRINISHGPGSVGRRAPTDLQRAHAG
ncbi:hypothetical protein GCM10020358_19200 [Amorphoplanes nipponensis]